MADLMTGLKRTNYCTELDEKNVGEQVVVCGWVQKTRDLGNLVFIDLRDRTGIVQLAFDDSTERGIFEKAAGCRAEFVVMAKGEVRKRVSVNTDIKTGMVEVFVTDLRVLSKSQTPPFEITDSTNVKEELRLKYRYLDLRRSEMQNTLIMRHKIVKAARDYYDENGFLEVETPILIKSTPEGARDYLVPSRVHSGSFFALPQSPQLYKQLLMLSGYDRYMQIARCFRDEDLRADRQPEFTQIDLEMSFVDQDDVMSINEGFAKYVFKRILDVDISLPLKRLPYKEAMERYGSDKPDTRFGLELVDLSDILKDTAFKVFAGALETGSIRAINVKGGAEKLTRKEIDKLADFVKTYKAKGLAYTRLTEENETSSFEKFLSEQEKDAIRERMGAKKGDVIFVVADSSNQVVFDSLGALRCELADRLSLIEKNTFDLLWVTDFPLFEHDEEDNRYVAKHHPFTAVADEDLEKIKTDPESCKAKAYDLVLNGCEVGGGSIRINNPELQQTMFEALGFTQEEATERFGFLIDAFKYGAPPHGGMAYGLDRLVMLMLHKESIRDVIAFPKVQNASELMTMCPAPVDKKQLDELYIQTISTQE
ncbi:MAG: aspS1 [Oscillospiraceae bacterium]|nr:aspS1 [Oscillospiraceae bacterium]